jgi:integrase
LPRLQVAVDTAANTGRRQRNRPSADLVSAWDRPYYPGTVTHRYTPMCARLGIDSHLHALRYYSATELLTAGLDLRTVFGPFGHADGGATTLRLHAARVGGADRSAAEILRSRRQRPPPERN